jgi:uncharacterized protein
MLRGLAAIALLLGLAAFTPPPLHGHVVDTTHALSDADVRDLDLTIDAMGNSGGFALVVLVTNIGDEDISDVAYTAFNKWGVGEKGKDNGILLVIAPDHRRVRIETGRGVEGALPDLKANDIIRQTIGPLLAKGELKTAIEDGAIAISNAVRDELGSNATPRGPPRTSATAPGGTSTLVIVGIVVLIIVVGVIGSIRRQVGRGMYGHGSFWWVILDILSSMFSGRGGGGGFGGGGFGGGGGWGGGDGGGSGYSGGGGWSDSN